MYSLPARVVFLAACFATSPPPSVAGALLQPRGHGQVIFTTIFSDAAKAYDARGRLVSAPSYTKFEVRTYLEYGVFDWLTIVAEPSYMKFRGAPSVASPEDSGALYPTSSASGPHYMGIGVSSFGVRAPLMELTPLVASIEASVRAATPSARRFLDMKTPLQADVRLQVARAMEVFGMRAFCDLQLGYRTRGQNGDEIRADVTYGLRPVDDVLLLAKSYTAVAPGGSFMASQKFELSLVYDVTQSVSVQFGGLAAVRGVNASAERGLFSGLWYRF
jgi:hypothetical protein